MKNKNFYPLITVYITNFNYEKYLKKSIKSVINQKNNPGIILYILIF